MSYLLSTTQLMAPSAPAWLEETLERVRHDDPKLTTVDLTHPHIDDITAKIFVRAMDENTSVDTLILSCYAMVDDAPLAVGSMLRDTTTLQRLQLKDMRNSRELITFFDLLRTNEGLMELSLRHCSIDARGANSIAVFLQSHSRLQEFRVTDSQFIGNAFGILCREGLRQSRSLKKISLVSDELQGKAAANLIVDALFESSVRELTLSENELGDTGVARLAQGLLEQNNVLELLDLRSNSITGAGAMALQGFIVGSRHISTLNLSNNDLSDAGVTAISRGLLNTKNSSLRALDLCSTGVQAGGASALATMLRLNNSLEDLNISFNNIGDVGISDIAKALQRNSKLRRLNLRRNNIESAGAQIFAKKLPYMAGLKELVLSKNKIGYDGATAILNGLRSNVELEYLHVEEKSETVTSEIVHYIRLNKAGRRIFRASNTTPDALWPHVYGRISGDVETVSLSVFRVRPCSSCLCQLFEFLCEKPDSIPCQSTRHNLPCSLSIENRVALQLYDNPGCSLKRKRAALQQCVPSSPSN